MNTWCNYELFTHCVVQELAASIAFIRDFVLAKTEAMHQNLYLLFIYVTAFNL